MRPALFFFAFLLLCSCFWLLLLGFCSWRSGFPFISNKYKGFAVRGSIMLNFLAGIPAVCMAWEGCGGKWRDGLGI